MICYQNDPLCVESVVKVYSVCYNVLLLLDDAGRQVARDRLGTDAGHHRGAGGSRVIPAVAQGSGEIWQDVKDVGQLIECFLQLWDCNMPCNLCFKSHQ